MDEKKRSKSPSANPRAKSPGANSRLKTSKQMSIAFQEILGAFLEMKTDKPGPDRKLMKLCTTNTPSSFFGVPYALIQVCF
jgi:hypothetical protein